MDEKKHKKHKERSQRCGNKEIERNEPGFRLRCWHPQWGGYSAHATVYHDGEFPTDDVKFQRHCCSALQFVNFGLDVYTAMIQNQQRDVRKRTNAPQLAKLAPVVHSTDELLAIKKRIDELLLLEPLGDPKKGKSRVAVEPELEKPDPREQSPEVKAAVEKVTVAMREGCKGFIGDSKKGE